MTVTWTDTFYPYGVEVLDEPIEHRLASNDEGPERVGPDGMRVWDRRSKTPSVSGSGYRSDPAGAQTAPSPARAYPIDVPVAVNAPRNLTPWESRGATRGGVDWLDRALARVTAPTPLRARGLLLAGYLSKWHRDADT